MSAVFSAGQTSAISNQQSTGNSQTNQGEASAVSVQQQSGLGGATQVTNNQAAIEALQQATGAGAGTGGPGQQSSNNQVRRRWERGQEEPVEQVLTEPAERALPSPPCITTGATTTAVTAAAA